MTRLVYIFILICILVSLVGCTSNENTTEAISTTEAVQWEPDETEYIDEAEWEFNDDVDKDEARWISNNQIIIEDISGIDWVESVSISPETYDEYVSVGKVTITITVVSEEDITSENEETINVYIDTTNFYDDYEIVLN